MAGHPQPQLTRDSTRVRCAVFKLLLADDPGPWSRAWIEQQVGDADALTVNDAITDAVALRIAEVSGEQVSRGELAVCFDELGLAACERTELPRDTVTPGPVASPENEFAPPLPAGSR
jgi:hypothetical protein